MGVLGAVIGKHTGDYIGGRIGKRFGNEKAGREIGGTAGNIIGNFLPTFKNGGRIKGKKGTPQIILAHSSEWVLPASVKPTKKQRKAIKKLNQRFV